MSTPIEQIQARIASTKADLAGTKADLAEAKSNRHFNRRDRLQTLLTKQYAVFEVLQRTENIMLAKEASKSASSASSAIFLIYCFVVSLCLCVRLSVCLFVCLFIISFLMLGCFRLWFSKFESAVLFFCLC